MKKNVRGIFYVLCSLLVAVIPAHAQRAVKRVLFLGNSYTQVNNLPQILVDMAKSTNDSLIVDSYTPGGYRLMDHSTDLSALTKMAAGNWDFVVLQEQSQLPAFTDEDVAADVFPYARKLDSLIKSYNPCAQTIFYRTWGRKNGDAQNCAFWPPVCTYAGMDSLLHLRYRMMADSNNALLSPVGTVWREIRAKYPEIELYQTDESHPALTGTYAAACAFYAVIFRKSPMLINYLAGLNGQIVTKIQSVSEYVVYDSLPKWNVGLFDPKAEFTVAPIDGKKYQFTSTSNNATTYLWKFGDGNTSTEKNPIHEYAVNGNYTVWLKVQNCTLSDSNYHYLNIGSSAIPKPLEQKVEIQILPNPASQEISIQSNSRYVGEEYVILNQKGGIVLKGILEEENSHVSIRDLPNGLYLFRLGSQQNKAIRFIKL